VDWPGLYFDGVLAVDFPYGVMVTVLSSTETVDKYGDTDAAAATSSLWGPCAVAPRTTAERVDSRSPAVITGLTVYGPRVTLKASDRLVINGDTYEIDGIPGDWSSPFTGWQPGIEVAVVRASGS
jgi:hypothetical protein